MVKSYCVYMHRFPNGKKYIGMSQNAEKRWRNGKGYETQGKIANAIAHYGWDNIDHVVILDGVSKEQAQQLEKFLIAELDTIENGYNTAIGGDNVNGTYLDSYILSMIHYVRTYCGRGYEHLIDFVNIAYGDRRKKDEGEFWNEASRAVTLKHGKYSTSDEMSVSAYWFHMIEYFNLYIKMQKGEDVSSWIEAIAPFERRPA